MAKKEKSKKQKLKSASCAAELSDNQVPNAADDLFRSIKEVGVVKALKNAKDGIADLLNNTDLKLAATLATVYAAAIIVQEDDDEWSALCEAKEWIDHPKAKASNYPAAKQTPPNRKGCVLEVDGAKAIDGACYWGPYSSEIGSFVMEANGYFAIIDIDNNTADGWWNETPGSTHAHARLGEMKRDRQCWKNKSVRVCVGAK